MFAAGFGCACHIEEFADRCRRRLERVVGAPDASSRGTRFLLRAIEPLGGRVEFGEFNGGPSLTVDPGASEFAIVLSPDAFLPLSAFEIAHELGHLFLHYPLANPIDAKVEYPRFGSGIHERQANRFAGALLMPRDEFATAWADVDRDTRALAARFGVLPLDAALRAESLGLAPPPEAPR